MKAFKFQKIFQSLIFKVFILIFFISTSFSEKSYSQAIGIGYDGYGEDVENSIIEVTASERNIQIFEDKQVKFVVPEGWYEVNPDSSFYYKATTDFSSKYMRRRNVKLVNERGDQVWIWRDSYDSKNPRNDANFIDDLFNNAPIYKHIKTITFKGEKRPYVTLHVWRAYHIHEGKRVPFKVFAGYREVPMLNPMLGIVKIFGISASPDIDDNTENDIIKMAERLAVQPKTKEEADKVRSSNKAFKKAIKKAVRNIDTDAVAKKVVANIHKKMNEEKQTTQKKMNEEKLSNMDSKSDTTFDAIKMKYDFQTSPGWANSRRKIEKVPVSWMIPSLKQRGVYVIKSEILSPDLLFIRYNNAHAVFNTKTGEIAWYDKNILLKYGSKFLLSNQDKIIVSNKIYNNLWCLKALKTTSGEELWSACDSFYTSQPTHCLYIESTNSLLLIRKTAEKILFKTFNWETGEKKWEGTHELESNLSGDLPLSFITKNQFIYFEHNMKAVSLADGKEIWQNNEIKFDDKNSILEISSDTVFVLDNQNVLTWFDANSGKTIGKIELGKSADDTNISFSDNFIFLRGSIENKKKEPEYFIKAYQKLNGGKAWDYSDSEMSLSNILEDKNNVYFSTWKDVISLNKKTGTIKYKTSVAEVGKTYPVTLHKFGDTLVYVGELTIAGVNSTDGKIIYTRGFDPVSQQMNLDAIDPLCDEHYEHLKIFGKVGLDKNTAKAFAGGFSYNMSNNAQQRANQLYSMSRKKYTLGDYTSSDILYNQARMESSFSRSMAQVEMVQAIFELAVQSTDNFVKKDRDRYYMLLERRKRLMKIYESNELFGEYAIKRSGKNDSNSRYNQISIVHLPTGKIIYSESMNQAGTDYAYNPYTKELYFHEYRLVPELESATENREAGTAAHAYYLVGVSSKNANLVKN